MIARRAALAGALLAGCRREAATDLDGRAVDPLAGGAKVTVLLYVATSCPISNRYAPEVLRLRDRFTARGVAFHVVYPNTDETVAAVREHARAYGYGPAVLRDPGHELVRRSGVTVTPEAAVFRSGGHLAYRGRIDDRFVDFGRERAAPTRRDLEEALEALLAGGHVPRPSTTALGCAITGR